MRSAHYVDLRLLAVPCMAALSNAKCSLHASLSTGPCNQATNTSVAESQPSLRPGVMYRNICFTAEAFMQDQTQTDLINLRRTIYLTIMSSAQFEEAGHKLMKIQLAQGQEIEVVTMLIECCSQEKTYIR